MPASVTGLGSSAHFSAIGTEWQVDTDRPLSPELLGLIERRVEAFDRTYSRFRADSLVTRVAQSPGSFEFPASFEFPEDAPPLFDLYDSLFVLTDGAVTPLVGRSLEQLGYDRDYTLARTGDASVPARWTDVARSGRTVTTTEPTLIDVGAAGKGYLVDLVGGVLRANGVERFVIDASGDLLASPGETLRIALEHPFDPTMAIGVATITGRSLCASGSNRRVWGEGLHHILDGRTGAPTSDVISTWAIADTALEADGLATALFFTDPANLAERYHFSFVRLFAGGRADVATNFPGELFT
ncbi:FAD:protein FMN transferase [soil metagenome]